MLLSGCQEGGPDPLLLGEDSPGVGEMSSPSCLLTASQWMPLALQALLPVAFPEEPSL